MNARNQTKTHHPKVDTGPKGKSFSNHRAMGNDAGALSRKRRGGDDPPCDADYPAKGADRRFDGLGQGHGRRHQ